MKKFLSGFVALILLLFMTLPAQAAVSSPPLSQISANPGYAGVSWSLATDSDELTIASASGNLWKINSTTAYVTASTQATQIVDEVGGTMFLQKWVNNAWTNVTSRRFYNYNTDESSGAAAITVESGYYYRLRTYHYADLGFDTVSRLTTTSSVFFN